MIMDDPLALESQVCFALAVASRSVVAAYREVLEPLGLTHPQYLVMLALWQHGPMPLKDLAGHLDLEPATVSPLARRLEQTGLVTRARSAADERVLTIALTDDGHAMRRRALAVPTTMLQRLGMDESELVSTNAVLHRIIDAAHASRATGATP